MKPALGGSITVRISARSLKLLKARARQSRQTTSEVVRELVERQLQPWPAGLSAWDLSREWVGSVHDEALPHGARVREALADWKPDRR
jgi:hypothetical protein